MQSFEMKYFFVSKVLDWNKVSDFIKKLFIV